MVRTLPVHAYACGLPVHIPTTLGTSQSVLIRGVASFHFRGGFVLGTSQSVLIRGVASFHFRGGFVLGTSQSVLIREGQPDFRGPD